MTTLSNNGLPSNPHRDSTTGEDTLRMIANLPAPAGLPDRIKTGLASAPHAGRIKMGRGPLWPAGGWMYGAFARGAAAAAIVGIVAGGGWQIYSHVQTAPSAELIAVPAPAAPQGAGFSSAGAKRVPETLQGPVLKHPVTPEPEINAVEKMPAPTKAVPGHSVKKKRTPPARSLPLQ